MSTHTYQYTFSSDIPIEDVEASLVLALMATESLHGETEVQLASCQQLDIERRRCVIDASGPVGQDLNRLLAGFLRREFGTEAFQVRRSKAVQAPDQPSAA